MKGSMKRVRRFLLSLAAGLLLAAAPGRGEVESVASDLVGDERILSFRSDVTVLPDASLDVRETIRVRAARREINHGIYRDFPTRFRGSDGVWFDVPFSLTEVLRDGKPETWQTRDRENGIRAYIGNADLQLEPGVHTYTLAYKTERQLGFLENRVELVWNVTGYNWTLPIDEVEARVLLPHGVTDVSLDVATGRRGSKDREATASWDDDSGATFRANRLFQPGEGLRVNVKWPKGFVREPPETHWWRSFLGSNRSVFAGLAGLLLVLTYYVLTERHVARDRKRGCVAPRFEVPSGLSPAAIRVVRAGKCDERAFVATVVQMAVKGYLFIEERSGRYTLRRGEAGREVLAPEEALAADDLDLEWSRKIGIDCANEQRIGSAINDLKNLNRISIERLSIIRNREYLVPGVVLSVVVLISTLSFEPGLRSFMRALIAFLLFFWTIAVSLLTVQLVARWQDVFLRRGQRRDSLFHAASITVLAIPVFFAEIVGLVLMSWLGSYSYGAVLLGIAILNALFHYRFKASSSVGRGLLDQIEDFAAGLAAVESAGSPLLAREATPAVYEKFLPYAIALDCEEQWSRQCAAVLTRTGEDGRGYQASWFRVESADGRWKPAPFASAIGYALCAAIAASTAAPGSAERPAGGFHDR